MKFTKAFLLLLVSCLFCMAQSDVLPVDERGKFIYYELVEAPGIMKEQLGERAAFFLKKKNKDLKLKTIQGDTSFVAAGKLIINKTLLVMSHPSGEVLYNFQTEVRNGKFRFWLTNFNFIPYQRDRYGNFVTTTSKGTALEDNPGKLNAAQWKEYQVQTAKYAVQFAQSFKDHMAAKMDTQVRPKENLVVRKDW